MKKAILQALGFALVLLITLGLFADFIFVESLELVFYTLAFPVLLALGYIILENILLRAAKFIGVIFVCVFIVSVGHAFFSLLFEVENISRNSIHDNVSTYNENLGYLIFSIFLAQLMAAIFGLFAGVVYLCFSGSSGAR